MYHPDTDFEYALVLPKDVARKKLAKEIKAMVDQLVAMKIIPSTLKVYKVLRKEKGVILFRRIAKQVRNTISDLIPGSSWEDVSNEVDIPI